MGQPGAYDEPDRGFCSTFPEVEDKIKEGKMTNKELFDRAKEAIMDLHNDKSVPKEVAVMNLDEIRDEIEILIEGLKY